MQSNSASHGVLGKLLTFSKLCFPCASASSFQDTCTAVCKCPAQHPTLSWCLAKGIFVITCVNVYGEWGLARRGGMFNVCSPILVLIKNLLSYSALGRRSLCVCVSGRVSQESLWGRGWRLAPSGQRPTEETAGRGGVWELGLDAPLLKKKWV